MKINHMSIIKRAWRILWSYKTLWVFGIILALTTGGANGSNTSGGAQGNGNSGNGFNINPPPEIERELGAIGKVIGRFFDRVFTEGAVPTGLIALGIGLACLGVIFFIVMTIARYVSENALIKLVDEHETTGDQRRVKEGFRMGWSRSAFRQWLIGLVIGLPLVIAFIIALMVSAVPLLGWVTENVTIGIIGTIATIGLFFLLVFTAIVVGTIAGLLVKLAYRATALEDLGVFPSIGHGWQLLRGNLKEIGVMWLIMFGIGLAFTVVMIPAFLLLLAISGVSGGLLFLGVRGLMGLFMRGLTRWIVAGVIGIFVFFILLIVPLTFVSGLYEVFKSSVWTLTYRELTLSGALEPGTSPELASPRDEVSAEPEEGPSE